MHNLEPTEPGASILQPGDIDVAAIQIVPLMERGELVERLEPLVVDAYTWQFGFYHSLLGKREEDRRPSETEMGYVDIGVGFIAEVIQSVEKSDASQDKKSETIDTVLDIVVNGEYSGQVIDMTYQDDYSAITVTHDTDDISRVKMFGKGCRKKSQKLSRRIGLSRLYLVSPETADYLIQSQTIGLHGTRSGALTSILDDGLLSTAELRKKGKEPVSGEHRHQGSEGQSTVSLIDWQSLGWLKNYAGDEGELTVEGVNKRIDDVQADIGRIRIDIEAGATDTGYIQGLGSLLTQLQHTANQLQDSSKTPEQRMLLEANYPVVVAVDRNALPPDAKPIIPSGDIDGEFMIDKGIPKSSISMILVPGERITEVEKMCVDRGLNIRVVDLEAYNRAFKFDYSL